MYKIVVGMRLARNVRMGSTFLLMQKWREQKKKNKQKNNPLQKNPQKAPKQTRYRGKSKRV